MADLSLGIDKQLGELFQVLESPRRRLVLSHLAGISSPASVDTLVTVLRRWERRQQATEEPPPREALRTSLHHVHLPMLDEAGLVDYRPGPALVEPADDLDETLAAAGRTVDAIRRPGNFST